MNTTTITSSHLLVTRGGVTEPVRALSFPGNVWTIGSRRFLRAAQSGTGRPVVTDTDGTPLHWVWVSTGGVRVTTKPQLSPTEDCPCVQVAAQ